jgi:hypothetical protein
LLSEFGFSIIQKSISDVDETEWLRCYATSLRVGGLSPDGVIEFVLIYLILPAA